MFPRFTNGLVRRVSHSLEKCELRHLPRQPFDAELAAQQHAAYVRGLEDAGVRVTVLPEEPDLPDSTFVEDMVVMLDDVAIVGRPGVASREPEVELMAQVVAGLRPVRRIVPPATVEGGDVLRVGKTLFVGRSSRTNAAGIGQLEEIVGPSGYRIIPVRVEQCLHLKTGVTSPADRVLIVNRNWIDVSAFRDFEILEVPATEPWGANTLAVNDIVFAAQSSPQTARLLESKGLRVQCLDISELQKAEAGLTCLSVLS
jgi:dimethylargininase